MGSTNQNNGGEPQKRDFRQEVTNNIVQMLEKGVAPWQKPWDEAATNRMPFNPTTDRSYRGGNAVHLMAVGMQRGYQDPRWMTYKQAADQGWQVRRGERATQIEFWDVRPAETAVPAQPGGNSRPEERKEDSSVNRLVHRVYSVFNGKQIDGISAYEPKLHTPFEAVAAGEQILQNSGAKIHHDQADRAFHSRSSDSIHLPSKEAFKDQAGYYGTALHELAHWTGHPDRLNRQTLNEAYRFGDRNYAKEELRAELASVFMAAERGIPHNPEQHASYVDSWIKALKDDKNEIFRASQDASRAADLVLTFQRDTSIADQALGAGPARENPATGAYRAATLRQGTSTLDRVRDTIGEEPIRSAHDLAPQQNTQPAAQDETKERPDPLKDAELVATRSLGERAKLSIAQTESGTYKGKIIGETDQHIVQRLSPSVAVAHPKHLFLDTQPESGLSVSINYSNERPTVRDTPGRSKAKAHERGR